MGRDTGTLRIFGSRVRSRSRRRCRVGGRFDMGGSRLEFQSKSKRSMGSCRQMPGMKETQRQLWLGPSFENGTIS